MINRGRILKDGVEETVILKRKWKRKANGQTRARRTNNNVIYRVALICNSEFRGMVKPDAF